MLRVAIRSEPPAKPLDDDTVTADWEPVHCRKCRRMLYRVTRADALKERAMVETKCPKCGSLNYMVGAPLDET